MRREPSLLPKGRQEPVEPVITYARIPADAGRTEPHFEGARMDVEDLVEVEAPRIDGQASGPLLAVADVPPADFTETRRSRVPRLVVVVGVLALLTGAGVLAATFGGVVKGGLGSGAPERTPDAEATVDQTSASAELPAVDDSAGVRVMPLPGSQSTIVIRDPALDAPAATDAATVDDTAAPAAAPMPRVRPNSETDTANATPPQNQPAAAEPVATEDGPAMDSMVGIDASGEAGLPMDSIGMEISAEAGPAMDSVGDPDAAADVDGLMASVDRILARQKAVGSVPLPPGVYGPPRPLFNSGNEPLFDPGLEPLPPIDPLLAGDPAGLEPLPGDFAGDAPPQRPGFALLPQRRVFFPSGPTPPADIPNAGPPLTGH